MTALSNEKIIINNLNQAYDLVIEKASSARINNDLQVSVDFIWKEENLTLLFEVDSYNAAKIIFGEYVLLNQVKSYKGNCILVIIHCYKKYNIERTKKYLKFAEDNLKCKLPYVVFNYSEWHNLVNNLNKTELVNFIKNKIKSNNQMICIQK